MVNPTNEIERVEPYLDLINEKLNLETQILRESSIYETEENLRRIKLKCVDNHKYFLELKIQTYNGAKHLFVDLEPQKLTSSFDKSLYNIKFVVRTLLKNDWKDCIWLSDIQSSNYANELYLEIHNVENRLRQFINLVMINHLGVKWWDTYAPKKVKEKYSARQVAYKRVAPSYANVSDKLLSIDTEDLLSLMTYEIKKINNNSLQTINTLIDSIKETGNIRMVAAEYEKFVEAIKKECEVEYSIWKEIFNKYFPEEFINDWEDFSKNRNHIAHNKLIDTAAYKTIKKSIDIVANRIDTAEKTFENSVLSDEEKEKIKELEAILEFDTSTVEKDIMEAETGVSINNIEEIEDILNENIMNMISDLKDSIYFRNDLNVEITDFSVIVSSGTIIEVSSVFNDSKVKIDIVKDLDDSPGSESKVYLKLDVDSETIEEAQIIYQNGEANFEEELGYYMPVHQNELYDIQKDQLTNRFIKEVNEIFPNLVEEAEHAKYIAVKDGGNHPVADFSCDECGEDYVCIDEDIAEIGMCLSCGYKHSVNSCARCENYYNEDWDGNSEYCQSCIDWFKDQ